MLSGLPQGSGVQIYIGGPSSAASGWTADLVSQIREARIPINAMYVPSQSWSDPQAQAKIEAAQIPFLLEDLGLPKMPVCMDFEEQFTRQNPNGAADFCASMCSYLRSYGISPGAYGSKDFLTLLAGSVTPPDFVILADWVAKKYEPTDPHTSPLPSNLWVNPGQRGWQYAGGGASLSGVPVDLNALDFGICLIDPPPVVSPPPLIPPDAQLAPGSYTLQNGGEVTLILPPGTVITSR
ncbi:MAG: DUF1906 domain-containing protein [Patescibacteria group bacterium]|nr:DUF1906 domain-containing protein [Patescibacteria group bacterium]